MTRKQRAVLGIMILGTFFGIMCSTMMNIALPTLMKDFNISSARVQWFSLSECLNGSCISLFNQEIFLSFVIPKFYWHICHRYHYGGTCTQFL